LPRGKSIKKTKELIGNSLLDPSIFKAFEEVSNLKEQFNINNFSFSLIRELFDTLSLMITNGSLKVLFYLFLNYVQAINSIYEQLKVAVSKLVNKLIMSLNHFLAKSDEKEGVNRSELLSEIAEMILGTLFYHLPFLKNSSIPYSSLSGLSIELHHSDCL